ncbi:unnamed protein product [Adineta steineri]|uniref:Uncharacterized protein n=1 Tax=Adineta steineri TaxID=433720 RepID=A0A814Z9A0_9BILA|nr:unnamed protein product [Adineta steineri]CAF1242049.1 unnamed protein product [Adineta steineri]CAF3807868.1 unnamed protein product [Adineta steineri]CAF4005101.1 unnamed protein product [Adineta steineri]
MNNSIENTYPLYSYIPSRYAPAIFATIIYISSIAWLAQSLISKCRPCILAIFIFVSHFLTFIELVLRSTLNINVLKSKLLYRITAPLLSLSPRLLLLANYRCLVELRGKEPRQILDRIMDTMIPIGVIIMDSILCIADELSFHSKRYYLSFHLRQSSAGFVLGLSIFFFLIWYLSVSYIRRRYLLPLLIISSICILIEAIYVLAMSIPSLFIILTKSEFYYYVCHLIPIFIALISWSIYHPWRLLPPLESAVPHDVTGKELLRRPPSI